MFGVTPAYGFYVRHVRGITFDNVEVSFEKDDARPAFFLDGVKNVEFFRTNAELLSRWKDVCAEKCVGLQRRRRAVTVTM